MEYNIRAVDQLMYQACNKTHHLTGGMPRIGIVQYAGTTFYMNHLRRKNDSKLPENGEIVIFKNYLSLEERKKRAKMRLFESNTKLRG